MMGIASWGSCGTVGASVGVGARGGAGTVALVADLVTGYTSLEMVFDFREHSVLRCLWSLFLEENDCSQLRQIVSIPTNPAN